MDTIYADLNVKMMSKIMLSAPNSRLDFVMDLTKYGDVVRSKGPFNTRFFINDPDTIYQVLVKNASNYTKEGTSFMRVTNIIGEGQLTNSGPAWQESRKAMQPNFYHNNLGQTFGIINQYIDEMLDDWQDYANNHNSLNIMEEMSMLVLKISTGVLFGQKPPFDARRTVRRFRYANGYMATHKNLWTYKPTIPNMRYQNSRRFIHDLCLKLIDAPHDDYPGMSPLLEHIFLQGNESPEEIRRKVGEATNYLLAGHDTTASALNWAFYLVGHDYAALQELVHEAKSVLKDQAPSYENYQQLEHSHRAIQETLRWFPPVWSLERTAIAEDQFGPMKVPAGSYVFMCQYAIHRHPQYWDFPNDFHPDHFLPKNTKNRPKCAYIPFGMGPRVCIGQHLAMMIATCVLSKVVKRYHFKLANDQEILMDPLLTLKPSPDVRIQIQSLD